MSMTLVRPLALETLLALPEARSMRVLAGESTIATLHVKSIDGAWSVHDLTSTSNGLTFILAPVELGDWHLDVLLRKAWNAGVRCVVLRQADTLAESGRLLAERLNLVVLSIDDPWPCIDAFLTLGRDALAVADHMGRELAEQFRSEHVFDLRSALHLATRVTDHPTFVIDATGTVIAASGESSLQTVEWGDETATLVDLTDEGGARLRARKLSTGIGVSAWVAAQLITENAADEAALLEPTLDVLALRVAHIITLARLDDDRLERERAALLHDLFASEGKLSQALAQSALNLGWQLSGSHVGLVLSLIPEVEPAIHRNALDRAVSTLAEDACIVERPDGWYLWFNFAMPPTSKSLASLAARIRTALRERSISAAIGMGNVGDGPEGLIRTLQEAESAVSVARRRPNTGHFVQFATVNWAPMLLGGFDEDTLGPFALGILNPLRGAGGKLLNTLEAYLNNESSVTATADSLGVHRNTVAERIQQIEQLLQVDLGDRETRLALQLAVRAVRR